MHLTAGLGPPCPLYRTSAAPLDGRAAQHPPLGTAQEIGNGPPVALSPYVLKFPVHPENQRTDFRLERFFSIDDRLVKIQ